MRSIKTLLLIVSLIVLAPTHAQTTTIIVDIDKDSYIDDQYVNTNYGTDTLMKSGTYSSGSQYYQRVFVGVDLSSIPEGAYVANAKLRFVKSGDVSGSNPWRTYRVDSTWYEDSITAHDQPAISSDVSTVSSVSGDTVTFTVATIINQMHLGLMDNYGLCVQVQDETETSTTGATFYSSDHSDSSKRPWLEITYYYPMEVSNVQITHASTDTTSDGSIGLAVIKGTEGYTYEWIDGATGSTISTDSIIDSLDYGWYGLHVTGTAGDELYQAFMVGVYCDTVDVTFQPSGDYTNYAYVYNADVNGIDYAKVNFGNSIDLLTSYLSVSGNWVSRKGYLDFNLWLDKNTFIEQADLTFQGKSHTSSNWRLNKADLNMVTELWDEEVITYNNQPTATSDVTVLVDSVSTSTQDRTMDVSEFWNYWRKDNNANYGMQFQLQDFTTTFNVKQHYHSPNNGTAANRPSIDFTIVTTHSTGSYYCYPNYTLVKSKIGGESNSSQNDYLYFAYDAEYDPGTSTLDYNVFQIHNLDTAVIDGSVDTLSVDYGRNEYALDVSSLTTGQYYILIIQDEKYNKYYMRFEKD